MAAFGIMTEGVRGIVAPATDVAADEADPEILVGVANAALIEAAFSQ